MTPASKDLQSIQKASLSKPSPQPAGNQNLPSPSHFDLDAMIAIGIVLVLQNTLLGEEMENALLIFGLVFPMLSWLTLVGGAIQSRVTGKGSSGVYIPFIGPILIDIWLLGVGAPAWSLIIPWLCDIGTLFFLWLLPQMVVDGWRTSRFTRTFIFVGTQGNQNVEISLHKGGRYVLKKQWLRPPNECGITGLGEPGTFEQDGDQFTLTSHTGWVRVIQRRDDEFLVTDHDSEGDYQLDGWKLQNQDA